MFSAQGALVPLTCLSFWRIETDANGTAAEGLSPVVLELSRSSWPALASFSFISLRSSCPLFLCDGSIPFRPGGGLLTKSCRLRGQGIGTCVFSGDGLREIPELNVWHGPGVGLRVWHGPGV